MCERERERERERVREKEIEGDSQPHKFKEQSDLVPYCLQYMAPK